MAEAPKPEDSLNAPQQEKKEEKKPIDTLESILNETGNLLKTGVNLGLATAVPFTQAAFLPQYASATATLAGAQVAGDATTDIRKGKKYTAGSALESSLVGTATTIPTYHMFDLINKVPTDTLLGYGAKAAAWGGLAYPAYIGMYQFLDYVIKNRTFKGVGKYIKENYWPTVKRAWKTTLLPSILSISLLPLAWQIPVSALIQYVFTLFGAPKKDEVKEEDKRDKTPYYVAAPRALGRGLKSIFYGVPEAVYSVSSALGEKLSYKAAPKPAAPAPAAQPV